MQPQQNPLDSAFLKLAQWFKRGARVLPWRDDPSTYPVWISEIMLQQTQVVTVIPFFEKFMRRFPTVEELAQAPEEEVLLHWAGLGYYSRARNLHRGAKMIVGKGRFPETREEWLEIPGVGPYTAGAILSIALNQPEAILDGNVERVLARVEMIGEKSFFWERSRAWLARAYGKAIEPRVFNQALMELGATVCTPRSPVCERCPLVEVCQARAADRVHEFPVKKKRKEWIKIDERVICLMNDEGEVLLERRPEGEWRGGLWDFPSELPLARAEKLDEVESKHIVTRHKIKRVTEVWKAGKGSFTKWKAADGRGSDPERRWVPVSGPLQLPVGSAFRKSLQYILERYPLT